MADFAAAESIGTKSSGPGCSLLEVARAPMAQPVSPPTAPMVARHLPRAANFTTPVARLQVAVAEKREGDNRWLRYCIGASGLAARRSRAKQRAHHGDIGDKIPRGLSVPVRS